MRVKMCVRDVLVVLMTSLAVVAALTIVPGCTPPVTVDGQPVTEPTIQRAAQAVRAADVTAASVVQFLIAGHRAGTIPSSVLEAYLWNVGPPVQAALTTARDLLVQIAKTPGVTTEVRVQQALVTLTTVLQHAITFAQQHGWQGGK